jgi:hypothetical protein
VLDLSVELGELSCGFLAVLAPFLPPAYHPLQPFELHEASLKVARIGNHLTIGECGQVLDTQIDAHHGSGVLRDELFLFHLDTHIPVPRLLAHRRRKDLDPTSGQIVPLFEPQAPEARQDNRLL